ncbi:MAG TPA: sigma-70 family RNA polymerase sigma factor [Gemmatimonadales bacterium]|nr:sigma-70 family RNA polymerase sigma factor [Gemmatimonadales bacterium]
MPESPDRTAGIRDRDPAVLEAIVDESLPLLLRAARAAGLDRDAAEDAVQETFLVFVRRAHEFDGRARAKTWLYGILLKKISEGRRALARDAEGEDIDAEVEARFGEAGEWIRPPRGPAEELARGEVRRQLGECLDAMPARQRQAFVLREVEELETGEICDALAVSANNLGVLLYRARNRIRECLEAKGLDGSADAVV